MKPKELPETDFLMLLFRYCPLTGELRWNERDISLFPSPWIWKVWNTKHSGTIAGGMGGSGYRIVKLGTRNMFAHRVIWKIQTGTEPQQIDHINSDRSDNRWSNLRAATTTENSWNRRLNSRNKSGLMGAVLRPSGRFEANAKVGDRYVYLGMFDTEREAHAAYCAATKPHRGAFFRVK